MTKFNEILQKAQLLHVQQIFELWEVLAFETRNKYRIYNEDMEPVAYAAEVQGGFLGSFFRVMLGHWRTFEIHLFDNDHKRLFRARFPFRWFFKTLYLQDHMGKNLGHLQQRFSLLYKKFDLYDSNGRYIANIQSPFFKIWTLNVESRGRQIACIKKKWSGGLSEIFTDRDNFVIEFDVDTMPVEHRALLIATTLMFDITYFENNRRLSS